MASSARFSSRPLPGGEVTRRLTITMGNQHARSSYMGIGIRAPGSRAGGSPRSGANPPPSPVAASFASGHLKLEAVPLHRGVVPYLVSRQKSQFTFEWHARFAYRHDPQAGIDPGRRDRSTRFAVRSPRGTSLPGSTSSGASRSTALTDPPTTPPGAQAHRAPAHRSRVLRPCRMTGTSRCRRRQDCTRPRMPRSQELPIGWVCALVASPTLPVMPRLASPSGSHGTRHLTALETRPRSSPDTLQSLWCIELLEPGDDMGTVDEPGPGQWRRIEVRVPRREVSAVIDKLAEKVELSGAGGSVRRCSSA